MAVRTREAESAPKEGAAALGPALELKHVSLDLGNTSILHKVSFRVEPGTIHCLIGPNGAGKTSLLRTILGQMPHEGVVKIRWGARRGIGYVPQRIDVEDLLPLTLRDFIALSCQRRPAFLGMARRLRAEFDECMQALGLAGKVNRMVGQLSGGERQRLLFAQALIPMPGLLILDEPLSSLDRQGAELIQERVRQLADTGMTILWVHHDLKLVREMADAVTCVNRTLRFSGDPAELLSPERVLEAYAP
ncbi:MAG: ATP-binding cassette domain-containing protein [Candidatus Hydrogenedens sp.]|nr:ATP-binding cassette domain-containing protein [Candidatus Hydrogenedens sp.]